MAPAQPDRYEPLPPLLEIPGHLLRKLSPRGRRAGLVLLGLVVIALAVGVPALVAAKHRHDEAAAREAARGKAARLAELRAELRQVDGRGTAARGLTGAAAPTARHALKADLSTAISADASIRARRGEFAQSPRRVECSRFPPGAGAADPAETLAATSGRYACLAVTADFAQGDATTGGSLGYPYRALVDFSSGRFTFCKISGRPGEMVITRSIEAPVPPACGGS